MTFVVGEIGVNWEGDFELLKKLMINSKNAGCDAVKFQSFNEEIVKDHPEKERLLKTSVSDANIEEVNDLSKKVNIEWFSTPMYPEAVDLLNPYVNRFKLRFFDGQALVENKTTELIQKILDTEKEIFVSSQKNPKNCDLYEHNSIKWLYVVPKYPCSIDEVDFTEISDFDGYSNHCPEIIVPVSSVILGGKILEVHITNDKTRNFLDNPVSFDFEQLTQMIKLVRQAEKLIK